jgi:tRNA (guanine9-N1)-methyltransferase
MEPLSKNAQKRLLKQQRFDETRDEWKEKQRQARKERMKKRKEAIKEGTAAPLPKRIRTSNPATNTTPFTAVIDLSFTELMNAKEFKSICSQITRCYAFNRRAPTSIPLVVSSFGNAYRERFEAAHLGYASYPNIRYEEAALETLFPLDKLVYLTGDSPHVLHELQPDDVYVIGGIVDRNRHKVAPAECE